MRPIELFLVSAIFFQIAGSMRPSDSASPEALKPAIALILKSANINENTNENGEFISELRGNVVFTYDSMRIRSDEATWRRKAGTIEF